MCKVLATCLAHNNCSINGGFNAISVSTNQSAQEGRKKTGTSKAWVFFSFF